MTIATQTSDRKALVKAIALELGIEARYLGTPSYAYQVGEYTIDRDGNIQGEDFRALDNFLRREGYIEGEPEPKAELQVPADSESSEEAHDKVLADSKAESITSMEVSIPAPGVIPEQLRNLIYTLYARQVIINRMTDSECLNIPDILIDRLKEHTPETPEAFTALLDDLRAVAGLAGFDYRDGKVSMTFPFSETEPEKWTAYANLLNRIYSLAMQATRVIPKRMETNEGNEKFLAHAFLQRLGYQGAEFKAERKMLQGHLKGYCGFSSAEKMRAHCEKYAAIRQEHRLQAQRTHPPKTLVIEVTYGG